MSEGAGNETDLAAMTLAAVRKAATRGLGTRRGRGPVGARQRGAEFSGAHADDRDPALVVDGLSDLVATSGWESRLRVAAVLARWGEIAGGQLAAHVEPSGFDADSGLLSLRADSTTWATQVRALSPQLLVRLDEALGVGAVRQIEVSGPRPPRTTYGKLRVPGRGPRDTYG